MAKCKGSACSWLQAPAEQVAEAAGEAEAAEAAEPSARALRVTCEPRAQNPLVDG